MHKIIGGAVAVLIALTATVRRSPSLFRYAGPNPYAITSGMEMPCNVMDVVYHWYYDYLKWMHGDSNPDKWVSFFEKIKAHDTNLIMLCIHKYDGAGGGL